MARKPLDIPWEELMCDRGDAEPVVEVVACGGGDAATSADGRGSGEAAAVAAAAAAAGHQAPAGESCSLSALTDQQLTDKIERLERHIRSGILLKLPDKGVKLLANHDSLEEERKRRKSLSRAIKDKEDEEFMEIGLSKRRFSPDSLENSSSNATTSSASKSFGFHFSKFLETKADGGNCDAYSEELSFLHKGHARNLNELDRGRNSQRISSRASPFQGPKSSVNKDKQQSCNSHHKIIALHGGSSRQLGKKWVGRFPKRRKYPESHGLLEPKSTEVQDDVVLLDEDVQPVEQIQEGDEPDEWLTSSKKEAKIYYPSRDHPECVELCQSDIKCLEPESYLSSTIMNFYIQYLQKTISSSERQEGEYHFCNTYFYSKLEAAMSHKGETSEHLARLRRWWKGVNIFKKAYIFLPVHGDLHWSLVIICIPAKEDESGPIILHLDSLGFHASNLIFEKIERYLKEEWKYLNDNARPMDLPFSERIWKNLPRRIEKKKIMVPQQKNEYDCGLFVLYFMERFIQAAPARLRKEGLNMFGSKWFHPEEASGLRKRLRSLILDEFVRLKECRAESPSSPLSSPED